MTLEYTKLRVINVENFAGNGAQGVDVRKVDLRQSIDERMGAANKAVTKKELRNVGPSITYKLRDAAGQAREYNNYMLPVDMGNGEPIFLMGVRESPSEPFRYLRLPADDKDSLDGFLRIRTALADPSLRGLAVGRYVARAVDASRQDLVKPLTVSASRALDLFAGVSFGKDGKPSGGLQAVSDFIETNVPEAERAKAGDVLIRILNGALFELTQISLERAGLKPLEINDKTQGFMTQAVIALSDIQAYPAPMVFQLADFTQVQASVFQVSRAPGKNIVYLGCALLILGVFAMLYIRERRLWVWLTPQQTDANDLPPEGGTLKTTAMMALSTNRKTMDGDHEFVQLKSKLIGIKDE
jgi:cytochrome c biogenesis protein